MVTTAMWFFFLVVDPRRRLRALLQDTPGRGPVGFSVAHAASPLVVTEPGAS